MNVVVSGLMTVSGAPHQVFLPVQRGDVAIIVSPSFLAELHECSIGGQCINSQ